MIIMYCFARSGGTIFNKVLGSMQNTIVMSEVSYVGGGWGKDNANSYTTVYDQARNWYGIELENQDYYNAIKELNDYANNHNYELIIRDWSYIYFFKNNYYQNLPTEKLEAHYILNSIPHSSFALVRDAIDVWISKGMPEIEYFFNKYLKYLQELKDNKIPIYKFEDFTQDPLTFMQTFSQEFNLYFTADVLEKAITNEKVNGDVQKEEKSRGQSSNSIVPLPRKQIDENARRRINNSKLVKQANKMLGYPTNY